MKLIDVNAISSIQVDYVKVCDKWEYNEAKEKPFLKWTLRDILNIFSNGYPKFKAGWYYRSFYYEEFYSTTKEVLDNNPTIYYNGVFFLNKGRIIYKLTNKTEFVEYYNDDKELKKRIDNILMMSKAKLITLNESK